LKEEKCKNAYVGTRYSWRQVFCEF